jgi:hypothetical protein
LEVSNKVYPTSCAPETDGGSFSINQKPTPDERRLMKDWIDILVAFVNDDTTYRFGTTSVEQLKIITPAGSIEIQEDSRWTELIAVGKVFAGDAA